MIAYLITEDDKEIQNPIGRVLIKKFVNAEDESKFVYVEDHAYGTVHVEFLEYLKKICKLGQRRNYPRSLQSQGNN